MGDYLSELATKNIGTADVIAPRRAARFEPMNTPLDAQAESLFFQSENFDLEQAIEEERGEIKPNANQRRSRRMRLNERDEIMSSRDDSDEQISQTQHVSPAKIHLPVMKQIVEPIPSKMIEEVRETTNEILSQPRPTSPTIVAPKKSLPTNVDAQEETKMTAENASLQPRFAPHVIESKMTETKIVEKQIIEKQSSETPSSIVAKPRVSKAENHFEEATVNQTKILPPRAQASKQIAESAQKSDVPVINVTIGRVEVRAVQSSAPVKEMRPKPATLSLDEYLRQRRKGGGR